MLEVFLIAVGVCLSVATVVPLFKNETWWIRFFDFPRLQFVAFLSMTLVAYYWWVYDEQWYQAVFVGILIFSMFLQAYAIFPYTIFSKNQVIKSKGKPSGDTLRLMVSNVL